MSRKHRSQPISQSAPSAILSGSSLPEAPPEWAEDPNPKKPMEVFASHGLQCLETHRLPYFFRWLVEQIKDDDPTGPQQVVQIGEILIAQHRTYRRTVALMVKLAHCRLRIRAASAMARSSELTALEREERALGIEAREAMDSDDLIADHVPDEFPEPSEDALDHLDGEVDPDALPAR